MKPNIVFFRQDMRLTDNPALWEAAKGGVPVIPLYIFDSVHPGKWQIGSAQKWWLHFSLQALQKQLDKHHCTLILRRGDPKKILHDLIEETNAQAVFWNRCYEPFAIQRDTQIKSALKEIGIGVRTFNGSLLSEPWEIQNKSGAYYRVFTQYWKNCLKTLSPPVPLSEPQLTPYTLKIQSECLDTWQLLPKKPDWAGGIADTWMPGENQAKKTLQNFITDSLHHYKEGRNQPSEAKTSRLSPYLHMGEISPRQVWHAIHDLRPQHLGEDSVICFLNEIGWREFSYHLLYHFPDLPHKPFVTKFEDFKWGVNEAHLTKWQKGMTGYPIVDAGMRELWHTGWMHNRVRMITASFLTKDLLISWQKGEEWFWDTLVDADLANNAASWQWVAGCGADAAPYFRIFNPVLQGEKFDSDGTYVKKWIPELAHLHQKYIHKPWEASPIELRHAGISLGVDYPNPVVSHAEARQEALQRFKLINSQYAQ